MHSRADVVNALQNLFNTLLPYFSSSGGARVHLGNTAALYVTTAAELAIGFPAGIVDSGHCGCSIFCNQRARHYFRSVSPSVSVG
jgi:hypothetical protein